MAVKKRLATGITVPQSAWNRSDGASATFPNPRPLADSPQAYSAEMFNSAPVRLARKLTPEQFEALRSLVSRHNRAAMRHFPTTSDSFPSVAKDAVQSGLMAIVKTVGAIEHFSSEGEKVGQILALANAHIIANNDFETDMKARATYARELSALCAGFADLQQWASRQQQGVN